MKIEVARNDLLKILEHVQSVVERRNSQPILANVMLKTIGDDVLEITATDTDISVTDRTTCITTEPGSITLSAVTCFDIVQKSPNNARVLIDSTQQSSLCLIVIGNSEFNLPTLPAETFPSFEIGEVNNTFRIHAELLKTLLSKTKHAISKDETRYYLNGIYLHPVTTADNIAVLRAVATDGHRLAQAQSALPQGCDGMPGIILPRKTVSEIIKLLEGYAGEVEISLSDKKISLKVGSTELYSKLIDGKYPDYTRVIPQNNDKFLEVSREHLMRSIDLVISISSDKTKAIKFNIEPEKLTLLATSVDNGNAKGVQEIQAKYSSGEKIDIDFNSRYVLDSLNVIDGDNVKIALSDKTCAVIAQDANESNCLYILMPLQV